MLGLMGRAVAWMGIWAKNLLSDECREYTADECCSICVALSSEEVQAIFDGSNPEIDTQVTSQSHPWVEALVRYTKVSVQMSKLTT